MEVGIISLSIRYFHSVAHMGNSLLRFPPCLFKTSTEVVFGSEIYYPLRESQPKGSGPWTTYIL